MHYFQVLINSSATYFTDLQMIPQSVQPGGRWCSTASPNMKRHLYSRPRQKGSPEITKIRELGRGQIVFLFSVEGILTLKLAFFATLDVVPRPLFRAH